MITPDRPRLREPIKELNSVSDAGGHQDQHDAIRPHEYSLLSVIVPVFNERPTVAEVIRRIRTVELPVAIEVIVVDDGSTDGTDKVLAAVGDSTIRVISHRQNREKARRSEPGWRRYAVTWF